PSMLAFNHRGNLLANSGFDSLLHLRDPATGRELLTAPGAYYTGLRFSADDRMLGMIMEGQTCGYWEVAPAREFQAMEVQPADRSGPWGVAFNPDGRWLATASADGARFWDPATGRNLGRLPAERIFGAICQPNGSLITAGSDRLRRWTVAAGSAE